MSLLSPNIARLRREETVLLIVDLQERLVPAMFESEALIRNCTTLAAAAAQLQIPIVITEQYPQKLGSTLAGITAAATSNEVAPAPVAKMLFSACTDEVQQELQTLNRRTILVCGIEAHVCVMQSTLDLLEAGFNVFVPYDAISSRGESNKKIGWERMLRSGVLPTSTESAIFELLREAGTPDFKAMLPLIK